MSDYPHRVQIESVRWFDAFPGLRIFGSLRQCLAPTRMFFALMLVVLLYLGGKALDFVWGDQVRNREIDRYLVLDSETYSQYLGVQPDPTTMQPIFQTLLEQELTHFNGMVRSALALDFGITDLLAGDRTGVIGHIEMMVVTLPGWLFTTHPGFSAVFLIYTFVLTMILGGAITRLAALDACRGVHGSPFDALRFATSKAGWLIAAPLLPLALVGLIGAVLAGAGLIFFNLPVLDVIGGLLFIVLLALGALAAVILLGLAFSCNLLTPAIAVEDSSGFDAVSRSFSYVLAHPWRYLFYLAVTIVYGAIGYLLVGLVLFLTLWVTKTFVSLLVFAEASEGINRFDAILPDPRLGEIHYKGAGDDLGGSAGAAAMFVGVWVKLLLALLPAYCVSFYFTAVTWIYLLLRRSADGAAFDEIAMRDAPPPRVPDKVEPAPTPSEPDAD